MSGVPRFVEDGGDFQTLAQRRGVGVLPARIGCSVIFLPLLNGDPIFDLSIDPLPHLHDLPDAGYGFFILSLFCQLNRFSLDSLLFPASLREHENEGPV